MGAKQSTQLKTMQKFIKKELSEGTSCMDIISKLQHQKVVGITIDRQRIAMDPMSFYCCAVTIAVPCKDKIKMISKKAYGYDKVELYEHICIKIVKRLMKL